MGFITYPDGSIYEGEFKDEQRVDGIGKLKYISGIIFEGEF